MDEDTAQEGWTLWTRMEQHEAEVVWQVHVLDAATHNGGASRGSSHHGKSRNETIWQCIL